MKYAELLQNIDYAYTTITERLEKAKAVNEQSGQVVDRIHYEDISLEDIMDTSLLPLLPELIEEYSSVPFQYRIKSYRVYVATLCELVKNGLVNGGILKTMDARMGVVFDRNHHYALLQKALKYEGIQVFENKHRKYEETIINEAGIPRNYHTVCLEIFTLYWKWLRNFEYSERKAFLMDYFDDRPMNKIYIIDRGDSIRFAYLKEQTQSFSQKVIKTCIKLDSVFSAIDNYSGSITEENINTAAAEISSIVGFNIFSVVRSNQIRGYILAYAKRVSFLKFERILSSLPGSEEIVLPNGSKKKIADYHQYNYIGGCHLVRGNAYEVSFPISMSIEELFMLPMQKIQMLGNAALYTSDEPIVAEIDGVEKPSRTFVNYAHDYRYIFYERIAAASFAYIDGIPVDIVSPFLRKTYIGKYWDQELQQYRLGLYVSDIRYANDNEIMRSVVLKFNNINLIISSTNHNGAFRAQDKLCFIEDADFSKALQLSFEVNNAVIDTWEVIPEDLYLWNAHMGIRIHDKLDVSLWFGPPIALAFSKEPIRYCSAEYSYQYQAQGYYVYSIVLDFSAANIHINERVISIKKSEAPYIVLKSKMDVISGEYCVEERDPISIDIENYSEEGPDCFLLIEHDMSVASYNLKNLTPNDYADISNLIANQNSTESRALGKAGKWNLTLVQNSKRISEITIVVVPYLTVSPTKAYYSQGEEVGVDITTRSACFESEGEYVQAKKLNIGTANLVMEGNHVGVEAVEFDCYIDKCGITKHLRFIPRVWGLRQKAFSADAWEQIPPGRMTYDDFNQHQIFVCSTSEANIGIYVNGKKSSRYIQPGYNRIHLRELIESWLQRTDISFEDEYGEKQDLTVVYSPEIRVISVSRKADGLAITIKYQGPVSSTLSIRVFSGAKLVSSASRQVYSNIFNMQMRVFPHLLSDPEITVEARIDGQDYQTIFHDSCEALPDESSRPRLELSANTGLLALMEYAASPKSTQQAKLPTTVLQLLSNRGDIND